jgi:hypothetical protein
VIKVKYTRPLVVSIIAIFPLSVIFGVTSGAGWIVALFPTYAIIGILVGFALAPLFLWVYKKIMGRNHLFSIQELHTPEKFHGMFKGLFPVLLATNFTLLLIFDPIIMNHPLFQDYYLQWDAIIFLFFNLCAILQVPAFALFSAAWIVLDSGIVTTDKDEFADISAPTELQSAGGWYLSFLKGYAGISVVLTLYQFTFDFLATYGSEVHWSAVFFMYTLPIVITLWVIPAIMLVSASYGRRKSYILGVARRLGIKDEFESSITLTATTSRTDEQY